MTKEMTIEDAVEAIKSKEEEAAAAVAAAVAEARAIVDAASTSAKEEIAKFASGLEEDSRRSAAVYEEKALRLGDKTSAELAAAAKSSLESARAGVSSASAVLEKKFRELEWL